MRARTLLLRLSGAACLAASVGLCWWLRESMAASPDQASPLRAALIFAGFALTLLGLRLAFARDPRERESRQDSPRLHGSAEPDALTRLPFLDPRVAQVEGITRRAIEAAARRAGKA